MRKGNSLKKMMAGVLSTAMIVGMLSGNVPMQVYAAGNAEAGDAAGRSAADDVAAETAGTEMSEADKTEQGNNGDQITTGQTTDMTGGAPEGGTTESGNGVSGEGTTGMTGNTTGEGTTGEVPPESSGESAGETSGETTTEPAEEDGIPGDTVTDAETDNILTEETALMEEYPEGDAVVLAEHSHDGIVYTPWEKTDMLPYAAGNYYLTENVTLPYEEWWMSSENVNLCLNGKTITFSENARITTNVIYIAERDSVFSLYDCAGGGRIIGLECGVHNRGTFNMYGGKITGGESSGVFNWGTFNMYGGEVSDGRAYDMGGGVVSDGTFNMYGGAIKNNILRSSPGGEKTLGGGVFVSGTFNMYGGEISGNVADVGGGVTSGSGNGGQSLITIKGDVVINGNKDSDGNPSNVYLHYNETIAFDNCDPAHNSVSIGIMTDREPTARKPINIVHAGTIDYSAYFHSDNTDYMIMRGKDNAVLILPFHEHHWMETWWGSDGFHWHRCDADNCYIINDEEKEGYGACIENDGEVEKEPTETEEGIRRYRCLVCEHLVRREPIPAIGAGGDKPDSGNDGKPDNGGGGEHPDDNNQSEDNPPENNTVGGSDSVINDQSGVPAETESAGASEEVIDAETDTTGSGEDVSSMETPVVIPEQPGDPEPKTADVRPVELYATLAMISGLIYVLLYFADRNGGMTEETKKELVSRLIRWAKRGKSIRRMIALAAIFMLLVYYHSIGKQGGIEWKEAC